LLRELFDNSDAYITDAECFAARNTLFFTYPQSGGFIQPKASDQFWQSQPFPAGIFCFAPDQELAIMADCCQRRTGIQ